jgi:signal transduction histidine kinase/ligand-binding sensor domain-containing protein
MLAPAMRAGGLFQPRLRRAGRATGLALGLVWGVLQSWGSELATNTCDYGVENWQVEQGLPHISVTSVAQTPDGYLWLGTFNGLVRFDGVRFTIFDEGNTPALGSSGVVQLGVDEQGALWILTITGGLVRMGGGAFTRVMGNDASLDLGGVYLLNDSTHRLVVLNLKRELYRMEKGGLRPLDQRDRLRTSDEPCLLVGKSGGGAFVAQHGKVTRSLPATAAAFPHPESGSNQIDLAIGCATEAQAGGYWLGTDTGIYRLQQGRLSARLAPLPQGLKELTFVREDGQGNLWAAGSGRVYRWEPSGVWQQFSSETGLADSHITCLFRDREGSLWIGTGQSGLYRLRPHVFHVYHTESGVESDVVTSVTQDHQGRMWFGINGGGLHELADGRLKRITEPALLRSCPLVYSVLADSQDAVWIGLYGQTALRLHAGGATPYEFGDGTSALMTPHALFEDPAGILWVGCAHSLLRYEAGRFTRYTSRDGLSCDNVVALAEDRAGNLYVGTDGGGLNRRRNGQFTAWMERDGLADNHVSSLYVDREDTVWIGTVNGGLGRFKQGRFATLTIKDGLPSNTIGSVLEDDLGNLWLGSNRGIIRVSRQALNDYADGGRSPIAWHVFGLSDGLSTIGCTGSGQPASWKAQDGKLWFATIRGAAMVDPNHLPFNPLPPPVVIEEAVMDDRVCDLQRPGSKAEARNVAGSQVPALTSPMPGNGVSNSSNTTFASALADPPILTVPPRTHRIEFHFTGLSLLAPEKVRFRFRLDPFDRDWIQAGTRRVANYTGILPGRYQFRVTACNNDGVWNETGAALGLVLLPPWWMTWWCRALAVMGVAGLVFGWYESRLHRLRRERLAQESFSRRLMASQENERQRLAGELHDGMGQDLLVIASQAQLSLSQEQNPPGTAARLKDIAETAKQALQQARLMAHNLRPGLLDELGFTKAVRASADKAAQASGLSIAVSLADVDGLLPPEFEVNLFRIIQETLNNVLKHAHASEAKITLTKEPACLRLVVEDNGSGFDLSRLESAPPDQRGFGLRQIAERAKMMGGRVDVQSRPGQGTRLTVEVPLPGSSKSEVRSSKAGTT